MSGISGRNGRQVMKDLGENMFVDNGKENNIRKAPGAQGQQGRGSTALNEIMERNKTLGLGRIWELLFRLQGRLAGQVGSK